MNEKLENYKEIEILPENTRYRWICYRWGSRPPVDPTVARSRCSLIFAGLFGISKIKVSLYILKLFVEVFSLIFEKFVKVGHRVLRSSRFCWDTSYHAVAIPASWQCGICHLPIIITFVPLVALNFPILA